MGGADLNDGSRIAVAVGNPSHAEQLTRTAADVARDRGGELLVVGVVVTPRESPLALFTDEVITRDFGGERRAILDRAVETVSGTGVAVTGRLFVAPSVWQGVLHAVEEFDCDGLVVGWQERTREDAVLGTNVDRIVSRVPCDVLVEKIGATADGVEAVLLPIAESPHAELAGEVARAIAFSNDARIDLLRVVDSRRDVEEAEKLLAERKRAFDLPVETTVRVGDVADVIVMESHDRDVTVLGATRTGRIRRRVVGSTPREVGRNASGTIVMAKRGKASAVSRLFRW
ncbi:universal stress protein [Halorussus halophilus]|uniref:universal stress protein n=1 Tax=Halorussus halophilus TaxID=2650975 RepID=UPI0013010EDC|nr:universal stress protein [Halorussus halophilus]